MTEKSHSYSPFESSPQSRREVVNQTLAQICTGRDLFIGDIQEKQWELWKEDNYRYPPEEYTLTALLRVAEQALMYMQNVTEAMFVNGAISANLLMYAYIKNHKQTVETITEGFNKTHLKCNFSEEFVNDTLFYTFVALTAWHQHKEIQRNCITRCALKNGTVETRENPAFPLLIQGDSLYSVSAYDATWDRN